MEAYKEALKRDSRIIDAWIYKGETLIALQKYEEAVEVCNSVISQNPCNIRAWISKGEVLKSMGNHKKALEAYENAISCNPENPEAWVGKGDSLFQLKMYEEALQSYMRILEWFSGDIYALTKVADSLLILEQYDEALEIYEQVLKLDQHNIFAWLGKGDSLFNQRKYEKALESYCQVLKSDKDNFFAWAGKGDSLLNLEKYNEALEAYEKATYLVPDNPDVWVSKSLVLLNLNKYQDSLRAIDKAIKLDTKDARSFYLRGLVLSELKNYEASIKSFQKVISLAPQDTYLVVDCWYGMGLDFHKWGKYCKAVEAFDQVLDIDSKNIGALMGKGRASYEEREYEEAVEAFNQVLDIDSKNIDALMEKGSVFYEKKEYEEARKIFDQVLDIDSKNIDALMEKGSVFYEKKEYEEARKIFDQVLEIDPKNIDALIEKGRAFCNQVPEIDPKNIDALMEKGSVFCEIEKYKKAVEAFDQVLEIDSKNKDAFGAICKIFSKVMERKKILTEFMNKLSKVYDKELNEKLKKELDKLSEVEKKIIEELDKLSDIDQQWIDAIIRSPIFCDNKEYSRYISTLENVKSRNSSFSCQFYRGFIHYNSENYDKAIEFFDAAITLKPEFSFPWNYKSLAYYEKKEYETALETIKEFISSTQENSKNIVSHIILGKILLNLGNLDGAEKEVNAVLGRDDIRDYEKSQAYCLAGQIKIEREDYDNAKNCFEEAIKSYPECLLFLLWHAYSRYLYVEFSLHSKEKYQEELLSIIRDLEKVSIFSEEYKTEKKLTHKRLKMKKSILGDVQKALNYLSINPEFIRSKLINLNLQLVGYESREKKLQREIRAYTLYFLGCFYYKIKDFFTASEKLEQCINLKSKFPMEGTAKKLIGNLWSFQIKPFWWEWWISSPTKRWTKRIIFAIILLIFFGAFLGPLYALLAKKEISLQDYLLLVSIPVIFLLFFLLSPSIERISGKELEIEMQHSPPPFELYLAMPPFKFEELRPESKAPERIHEKELTTKPLEDIKSEKKRAEEKGKKIEGEEKPPGEYKTDIRRI